MIPARCPRCFTRFGPFPETHICPSILQPKTKRGRKPKPKDPTTIERKPA